MWRHEHYYERERERAAYLYLITRCYTYIVAIGAKKIAKNDDDEELAFHYYFHGAITLICKLW